MKRRSLMMSVDDGLSCTATWRLFSLRAWAALRHVYGEFMDEDLHELNSNKATSERKLIRTQLSSISTYCMRYYLISITAFIWYLRVFKMPKAHKHRFVSKIKAKHTVHTEARTQNRPSSLDSGDIWMPCCYD